MTDKLIGQVIGGYDVLDVIGHGGMATVYRARQQSMNRIVALKVLPPQFAADETYLQRFHREARIVSQLEHRNIVPVYDYGEHEGQPYLVMRYMAGGSVDDLLVGGPLSADHAADILRQIAPALDYAHSKHVLHRDLKPSNVLLDDNGGAYLTDFGIARVLNDTTAPGITTQGVVGTPSYMSPEQAQGKTLDGRSDIYSLGITVYEMVTGRRPFESDTPYGIAVMQVTAHPPAPRSINPQVPIGIENVVLKALNKDAERRYANASEMAAAFESAVTPRTTLITDTQPHVVARQPSAAPAPVSAPPPAPVIPQAPALPQSAPPSAPIADGARPSAPSWAAVPPARRRRKRPGNDWLVKLALGAVIGCGLLTALLVAAAFALSNWGSLGSTSDTPFRAQSVEDATAAPDAANGLPTLNPTEQAARDALVPAAGPTRTPPPAGPATAVTPLSVQSGGAAGASGRGSAPATDPTLPPVGARP